MAIIDVKGVPVTINGLDETQPSDLPHLEQLERSLNLLPVAHLKHIPTIAVGNRPPRGGGGSANPSMPGGPYIRLNRNCFNSSWNQGSYNYTLLHEVGHIIDWAYRCMERMRRTDPRAYRVLLQHPHRGATQGPGEHYADAYADYFSGRRLGERLEPLRQSAAFRGIL
jgi:hypothetical protein